MDDPVSPLQGSEQEPPVKRAKEASTSSIWSVHPAFTWKWCEFWSQNQRRFLHGILHYFVMIQTLWCWRFECSFFIYFAGFCFISSVFKCFSSNNEARWDVHQTFVSRSRAFPRGKTVHDGGRFTVSPPALGLLEFHNSQQKCDGWWRMNDDELL